MNSISVLSSDHVQTISSIEVAKREGVRHDNLIRSIERFFRSSDEQVCSSILRNEIFLAGTNRTRKNIPKEYRLTKLGLGLLSPYLKMKNKAMLSLMKELNNLERQHYDFISRQLEGTKPPKQLVQIEAVKTKYGTAFLRKTPLLEKQIVVYRETDDGVKIPDEKCKAQELTGEQLFEAIADNYDAKAYGYERAAIKAHLGAKEYRQWKIKGEGPCPKPSDFKLKSEYEGFFEDLGLLRGV